MAAAENLILHPQIPTWRETILFWFHLWLKPSTTSARTRMGMPEHWSNILQFDEMTEDHLLFSLFFQRAWWNPLTQVIHVPNNCIQLCIFVPFGSKRQLSGKGIVPTSTTFSDGLYSRIPGRTLGGLWQVGGRVERGKGFAPGPCRREDEEGRLCLSRLSRALVTQSGFWLRRTCRVKVMWLGIGCAAGSGWWGTVRNWVRISKLLFGGSCSLWLYLGPTIRSEAFWRCAHAEK